jgi:hypothetical protein
MIEISIWKFHLLLSHESIHNGVPTVTACADGYLSMDGAAGGGDEDEGGREHPEQVIDFEHDSAALMRELDQPHHQPAGTPCSLPAGPDLPQTRVRILANSTLVSSPLFSIVALITRPGCSGGQTQDLGCRS